MMNELKGDIEQLAMISKALSHPIRLYILKSLIKANACCYSGDIAKELNLSASTLSLHFKELKNSGLIKSHKELPYIKYCINKKNIKIAKKLYDKLLK